MKAMQAMQATKEAKGRDPRRLDVMRLAADGQTVEGRWPLAGMTRLVGAAPLQAAVRWSVRGERRTAAGAARPCLHLHAEATVQLICQRCLQALAEDLVVDRWFCFVEDEAQAERLDEASDDDVLALEPHGLDLHALVEEELVLALPIVPRHGQCPLPLPLPADPPTAPDQHPFHALAALPRTADDAASGD